MREYIREKAPLSPRITIDRKEVADLCREWRIIELSLFGSVLREDFGPESDVDVLVTFDQEAHPSLLDLLTIEEQLEALFGHRVDLLMKRSVETSENYIRRKAILSSAEPIYAG
jgi:predicted nucleotidyltransferase